MTKEEMNATLDARNEATKVWIQSDTQAREYCHKLEADVAYWSTMFKLAATGCYRNKI